MRRACALISANPSPSAANQSREARKKISIQAKVEPEYRLGWLYVQVCKPETTYATQAPPATIHVTGGARS